MFEIHLKPNEVWKFFHDHRVRLEEEMLEIASNTETNTAIFLTEQDGFPFVSVYKNDQLVHEDYCVSDTDSEETMRDIYIKYMPPFYVTVNDETKAADSDSSDDDADVEEITLAECEDKINEREDEITLAIQALIEVLTEDSVGALEFGPGDETFEDIVDHIVEFLAVDCGFRVRRPMFIIDEESHEEVFSEYPYEEFDFEASREETDTE